MRIAGIYLAAGNSKRFGENKLTQKVGKDSLGSMALKTALKTDLDKIVVVTQKEDSPAWLTLSHFKSRIVHAFCPENAEGQAASLKCGLHHAKKIGANAVLIMLADQPLVSADMIDAILNEYKKIQKKQNVSFVASIYNGIPHPPILFTHQMYDELFNLHGDAGARKIVRNDKWKGNARFLAFSDSNLFFDVDTLENYYTLQHIVGENTGLGDN
ncbi:NTP transferase domain-containing protein [Virgibacillus oceani]|uniref:Xanthine dehydrogenase accessory protein PucB n=1 Tax=Virgibacillus oceani TaxID=1479511 RepID=A0A917HBP1_9BACI|nr:NTP transferase domain-containing protein [Virgibacillus oceani]GGG73911.1 xanthine dehydrogenase accessory protein PucB [Virgibacillus oceani]